VASRATIPSPRPPSASSSGSLSSGSSEPPRSVTSTRTVQVQAVTVTVTVSPGRPERLCRTLLPKAHSRAGQHHPRRGAPGRAPRPRTRGQPAPVPVARRPSRSPELLSQPSAHLLSRPHGTPQEQRTHGNARSPQPLASSRICVPGVLTAGNRPGAIPGGMLPVSAWSSRAEKHNQRPGSHAGRFIPSAGEIFSHVIPFDNGNNIDCDIKYRIAHGNGEGNGAKGKRPARRTISTAARPGKPSHSAWTALVMRST